MVRISRRSPSVDLPRPHHYHLESTMARLAEGGAIPGARFVDPTVLARIGKLDLLARTVVDGFINGLHRAPFFGASIDFAEHRGYVPGDDIRRVDWRLYARTDKYYVKQYEADTNTNFSILLDVSKSMGFTSGGPSKLEYACYLAACLAYMAHRQRDRVGIITFDDDIVDYVPVSAKHFDVLLHTLDRCEAAARGQPERPGQQDGGALQAPQRARAHLGLLRGARHHPRSHQAAAVPRQRPDGVPRAGSRRDSSSTTTMRRASRISRAASRFRSCPRRCRRSTGR